MSGKTYVVSDLHGRLDVLDAALSVIETNASGGTVVFTGDYVDRGTESKGVIDRLMSGPPTAAWRWICLKGNHEDMMVAALRGEADLGWWVGNGGGETLVSFGGVVPEKYIEWSDRLPHYHQDAHRVYVHAGVDPTKPMADQTEAMLLWFRCGKHQDIQCPHGYVVHGHTPFEDGPIILEGRANLDTGACWTGRLVVAVFEDGTPGKPIELLPVRVRA